MAEIPAIDIQFVDKSLISDSYNELEEAMSKIQINCKRIDFL